MRMILEGELKIRLEMTGQGFEITSEDIAISPYHLLAGSLASCIVLLIQPWADRVGMDTAPVIIAVSWEHVGAGDNQVKQMDVDLSWPNFQTRATKWSNAWPRPARSTRRWCLERSSRAAFEQAP